MVKHINKLIQVLNKHNLKKEDVIIVGSSVLAIKKIRENNDVDFSIINFEKKEREKLKKKNQKYVVVSKKVDCYYNRYSNLKMNDKEIINKDYYFMFQGYKVILPEIEFAYKIISGRKKDIPLIEKYISENPNSFDWELFRECLKKGMSKDKKSLSSNKYISLLTKGLKNPKEGAKFIYHKLKFHISKINFFYPFPKKELKPQLTFMMPTNALLANHFKKGKFIRWDLLMRYLTIDSLLKNEKGQVEQYEKMQKKRVNQFTTDKFERLISSIKIKGFSNNWPLPISQKGTIIDGSHRLACALYFNIKNVPVEIFPNSKERKYTKKWFVDNKFSPTLMKDLSKTRKKLFLEKGIYFPVLIWSPAKKHFEEIRKDIKSKFPCVFEKEFIIKNDYSKFIREIYKIDDIDNWKVELKNHIMNDYEPRAHFMLLEISEPNFRRKFPMNSYLSKKCEKLKKEIRNKYKGLIPNYFYDIIIHMGDNYEHNEEIIKIVKKQIKFDEKDIK